MSPSVDELLKQIQELNLIEPDRLESAIEAPYAISANAREFIERLISRELLTRFQAKLLVEGKGNRLRIGSYLIEDQLGEGGMGKVYRARHAMMDRVVAIKVLARNVIRDEASMKRFLREVKLAGKLIHPNIVTAFDASEHHGVPYLVMEYIEGDDLLALVRKNGPLTESQTVDAILQAVEGLKYAHEQGVIHRDIKPANLLIERGGVVRILDLGLARSRASADSYHSEDGLSESSVIMGTVDFMSPEQAINTSDVDERTDIYSLGCTMFFLLTGSTMYEKEDSSLRKLLAHRDQPAPSLIERRAGLSRELEAVYFKMVAKRPSDRFASMEEAIDALKEVKQLLDGGESSPGLQSLVKEYDESRIRREREQDSRFIPHRKLKFALLVALVSVCAVVFLLQIQGSPRQTTAATSPGPASSLTPPERNDFAWKEFPASGFVLEFDGKSFVELPSFQYDGSHPLTVEAIVTPKQDRFLSGVISHFDETKGWFLGLANSHWAVSVSRNEAPLSRFGSLERVQLGKTYHIACVLEGNRIEMYLDGRLESSGEISRVGHLDLTAPLRLGGVHGQFMIDFHQFVGWIHAVRISRVNRFDEAYQTPSIRCLDEQTEALYLFGEGRGTILEDASPHIRHGEIHNARWKNADQIREL